MIAQAMVSICAFRIAPPFLRVFLALASALWVDRLRSWIDHTSAQSRAKLVLDRLNGLDRSGAHTAILCADDAKPRWCCAQACAKCNTLPWRVDEICVSDAD